MIQADYGREDAIVGYAWMARYTLAFLDAHLKHDASAMAFIKAKPADNGVPKHLMAMDYRGASRLAPSFEAFRAEVGRRGFAHVSELYAEYQSQKSDFKLEDVQLGDWANELLADEQLSEAMMVLELDVRIHRQSSNAYARLGDAYALGGHKEKAIASYQEAVKLDPNNGNALRKLDLTVKPSK
jgi:tetratricopeptide (TPR) repeat protein